MRSITLALFTALTAISFAADTPADILADYQAKSAPVLQKLNDTLNKQAALIAAQLVSKGDAAGAEDVTAQVKAKTENQPVAKPHPAVAQLFTQYDTARQNALRPVQAAAYAKIDAALKSPGKDLAQIAQWGRARTEIEGGLVSTGPVLTTRYFIGKSWYTKAGSEYHFNKDGTGYRIQKMDFDGKVEFPWTQRPDGVVEIMQRKQPTAPPSPSFFRFEDQKTAFQGTSADNINAPLLPGR